MLKEDAFSKWGTYKGTQKKPVDFDAFWDQAKYEVERLGIDYQLEPVAIASNQVDCFLLTFVGVGGAKISCQMIRPKKRKSILPALLQFHGYHTNSGDWNDKIALATEGMCVFAMDVRGQGGLSEDASLIKLATLRGHLIRGVEEGPEKLFYRSVFQDVYQLTRIVMGMPEIDSSRLVSYGVSQGGALALVCAALSPLLSHVFVQYPFLSDYREAYRLGVNQSAYEELAYWFRQRDPRHEREEEIFATLDYIDIQYLVPRIEGKIYWAMALDDLICHPKTQFAVINQAKTIQEISFYPEYGHEYLPGYQDFIREKLFEREVIL